MLRRTGSAVALLLLFGSAGLSAEPALVENSTLPPQFREVTNVDLKEKSVTFVDLALRPVFETVEREIVEN
jgi:hypothetical protein